MVNIKKYFDISSTEARNGWYIMWEGAFAAIVFNLTNPFFSMFAKRLGAGDFHIGLISSLPAFAAIFALIPGALIVDSFKYKRKAVELFILLTAITFPLAAASPFMGSLKVAFYIAMISLLNWPFSIYNISWQSFFSDIFAANKRNKVYAARTRAYTFFGMVVTLAAGLIMSFLPKTDGQRVLYYQGFYMLAFSLSIYQIYLLRQVKENSSIPSTAANDPPLRVLKESFGLMLKDRGFMIFILTAFIFHVSWQMAWPLFFIYEVDFLHANEAWLSLINVSSALANVVTYSYWNKVIEKRGAAIVLVIGAIGLALNPVSIVNLKSLMGVVIYSAVFGLTFPAFQLGLFECMLQAVPEKNKTLNIAFYTTMLNISGFIAPLLGVLLYKATSIHFAMTFAGFFRFAGAMLFYIKYKKNISDRKSSKLIRESC